MNVNVVANPWFQEVTVVPNRQRGLDVTVDKWTSTVAGVP